jgi:RimJ/RimL family protein N-acetyltransferase
MIQGKYSVIRSAEADDAPALAAVYQPDHPRSVLLDPRHELFTPTVDELREVMAQKELGKSIFSVVEDLEGNIRGFCSLRGLNPEIRYSELLVLFIRDEDLNDPMADEAMEHLVREAFQRMKLNKVMTYALDTEHAYKAFLARHHFVSEGAQREVVYTLGQWHDIECFTLFRTATPHAAKEPSCQ